MKLDYKIEKAFFTQSSVDNIDQETDTLSIHFTNSNLFQPHLDSDEPDQGLSIENKHPGSTEEIHPFELNHLIPPPKFPNFVDDTSDDMVSKRFNIDIIWSITADIPEEICNPFNIPLLGSWTHFNKKIYTREFKSAVIQYMPTVPQPLSDYAVLHSYLQFLLQTAETLELKNTIAHCDEAVYSKLLHIIWSNVDTFKSITIRWLL